jgi:glycosyltransferase involved in cell wall biosynthesis
MTDANFRLAIVSDTVAPWSVGGRETLLSELLPELANSGVDVTIYTMRWWDSQPPDVQIGKGSIRVKSLCKLRPLYKSGRRSFVQAISFSFGNLRLLREDFDIIQTDPVPYFHLLPIWLISKIRRRPLVLVWHEVWGRTYWRSYLGALGFFGYLIERYAGRIGDIRLAVSRRTYRKLSESHSDDRRPVLVESAAREMSGSFLINSPELIFVGRLVTHKRPDLAIRILENLIDLPIRLCVVGSGPHRNKLETQVRDAGLNDRVEFMNKVSEEVLGNLLRSASVLLSPSECEGYGFVVAEALSLGTPVVTVDAPMNAAQEFIINNVTGRVCRTGDSDDLSRAVRDLLVEPLDRDRVKEGWKSLGTPKNFDEVAQKYLIVYQQLISSNRERRDGT